MSLVLCRDGRWRWFPLSTEAGLNFVYLLAFAQGAGGSYSSLSYVYMRWKGGRRSVASTSRLFIWVAKASPAPPVVDLYVGFTAHKKVRWSLMAQGIWGSGKQDCYNWVESVLEGDWTWGSVSQEESRSGYWVSSCASIQPHCTLSLANLVPAVPWREPAGSWDTLRHCSCPVEHVKRLWTHKAIKVGARYVPLEEFKYFLSEGSTTLCAVNNARIRYVPKYGRAIWALQTVGPPSESV